MAKKAKKKAKASEVFETASVPSTRTGSAGPTTSVVFIEKKKLTPISIDFGNEHLNNLGMKINEIIEHLNGPEIS